MGIEESDEDIPRTSTVYKINSQFVQTISWQSVIENGYTFPCMLQNCAFLCKPNIALKLGNVCIWPLELLTRKSHLRLP